DTGEGDLAVHIGGTLVWSVVVRGEHDERAVDCDTGRTILIDGDVHVAVDRVTPATTDDAAWIVVREGVGSRGRVAVLRHLDLYDARRMWRCDEGQRVGVEDGHIVAWQPIDGHCRARGEAATGHC